VPVHQTHVIPQRQGERAFDRLVRLFFTISPLLTASLLALRPTIFGPLAPGPVRISKP
jgi:hypothetical protein